jgi:arylsulfatase A-like enzyme
VVIVLDGLPTVVLQTYNPGARRTALDDVLDEALLFREARTNKVYTSGYFKTLLTGRLNDEVEPAWPNLYGELQSHGVRTRWLSFHANGIPESSRVSGYRGLRSALLTERFVWFPRLLGLDYNVFLVYDTTRQSMGPRTDGLYEFMNGRTDEERFWRDVVPGELRDLRRGSDRSLLLVHVSASKHEAQSSEAGDFGDAEPQVKDLYRRASASDYTYDAADEPVMERVREFYRRRADAYGHRLQAVLERLRQSHASDDTIVVLTADHGTALHDNKIWYGFHPDEAATRVPIAIIGSGLRGQSTSLVDTLDLTRTLSSYFGVDGTFAAAGRSLLEPLSPRTVPVLTVGSARRSERFLILYASPERKYVFNVLPSGRGERSVYRIAGFQATDQTPVAEDDPVWIDFARATRDFGLTGDVVHAAFAPRLK